MNIYVVIVTFNGEQWIERCLISVRESTLHARAVVIDNGSSDRTLSVIADKFPETIVIRSASNLGFGAANNLGISYALDHQADYVYLLNQDAWLNPDTLEILIARMQDHPEYGLLSPIQTDGGGEKWDAGFETACRESECPGLLDDLAAGKLKPIYEIHFVMAAHWLLSAESLRRTGGFSPLFHHYGEDNNWIDRARYHGFRIGVCPQAEAAHDRQGRKSDPERLIYSLYHCVFLPGAANIGTPALKAFSKSYYRLWTSSIQYGLRYKTFYPVKGLLRSLVKWPRILKYRKITRRPGPLFFNHLG